MVLSFNQAFLLQIVAPLESRHFKPVFTPQFQKTQYSLIATHHSTPIHHLPNPAPQPSHDKPFPLAPIQQNPHYSVSPTFLGLVFTIVLPILIHLHLSLLQPQALTCSGGILSRT